MPDSKAITPEIKELFEVVRAQAYQYVQAYESLETEINKLHSLTENVESLKDQIESDNEKSIVRLNSIVDDFIENQNLKFSHIQDIYNDFEKINALKLSLTNLQIDLKKQASELDTTFHIIKGKAEIEVETLLSKLQTRVDKDIEGEIQKIESRVYLKVRQMDSKLMGQDQKIANLVDLQNRQHQSLQESVEASKVKPQIIRQIGEESKKIIDTKIEEIEEGFDEKFDAYKLQINDMEKEIKNTSKFTNYQINDYVEQIDRVKAQVNEFKNELSIQESKSKNAMMLGVFAIIVALIVLLLKFAVK